MSRLPAKLYEAFEKIRLGKVEEGTRLFDRVDGFEPFKAIALAELAYFRQDWKRALLFDRDFFDSDIVVDSHRHNLHHVSSQHLEMMLVATCHLGCWQETRDFFEQFRKRHAEDMNQRTDYYMFRNELPKMISLASDTENTTRHIMETRPKLKTEGKTGLGELERFAQTCYSEHTRRKNFRFYHRKMSFDGLAETACLKATTSDHIVIYERMVDHFEKAETHVKAACSYIAMEHLDKAREALRRSMTCWQYTEPVQVAPIVLFTIYELGPILTDRKFTESLLAIPHHNET